MPSAKTGNPRHGTPTGKNVQRQEDFHQTPEKAGIKDRFYESPAAIHE
jgi:hypothetical protein